MTASNETRALRAAVIFTALVCSAIGIIWDALAALILFRSYTFFESVVICLLVMILCYVAMMRADFELSFFEARVDNNDDSATTPKVAEELPQLKALVKSIFYGIAFAMALVKLVLALIG
jgi:hypothetical protein